MSPTLLLRYLAALAILPLLSLQAQQEPFYPNDPYFFAGAEGVSSGYYGQWHLLNQMPVIPGVNAGLDVNILGAWQAGYTGKGVIISIMDGGTEGSHPDLNFYNAYSWDFEKNRAENLSDAYRGSPQKPDDNHGTAVAGLAGAIGGNGIGLTGAAPGAGIAALRAVGITYPTEHRFYEVMAAGILYQGQLGEDGQPDPFAAPDWSHVPIRVKNHSFGVRKAYDADPSDALFHDALNESAANGVIHVFSAGNYRDEQINGWSNVMDSGKSVLLNRPDIIVVSALSSNGEYTSYSSFGSNVFVTAPGGDRGDSYLIPTTDRTGTDGYNDDWNGPDPYFNQAPGNAPDALNYNSQFLGTSASAPIVSGIMALGVEANPDMNVRLAQHILVRTSRVVDPNDNSASGGWVTNSAGRHFNRNYGFGLIDATAFTLMAAQRGYATERTFYHGDEVDVYKDFSIEGPLIAMSYNVDVPDDLLQPIEYIAIRIVISALETDIGIYGDGSGSGFGSIQGDFSAWLISPDGTRQMLFDDDREIPEESVNDRAHYNNILDWEFLSYAYWGEMPDGDWLLELYNGTGNLPTGIWESFTVTIGMGDYVIPEPRAYALFLSIATLLALHLRRMRRQ